MLGSEGDVTIRSGLFCGADWYGYIEKYTAQAGIWILVQHLL